MIMPSRQVEQKPQVQRVVLAAVMVALESPGNMISVKITVFH